MTSIPPVAALSIADAQPVEDEGRAALLPFVTVAIGASAGGVEALTRFFSDMPRDSGCAFLVVMHLAAERESMLSHLLSRATAMPVSQAVDGEGLLPNQVFVGPPGHYLEVAEGRLRLVPIVTRPIRPASVDRLMTSLAVDQRERAVGIILSGADADGSVGIKAIKAEGGHTIAQTPDTATHASMPRSAIGTGQIDLQLAVPDMPAALLSYLADAGLARDGDMQPTAKALPIILDVIRENTGLDFRGYKTPMLQRRVRRRMGLSRTHDLQAYLPRLRNTPEEVTALAGDFLISVTEFFREPDSWDVLAREVVSTILQAKEVGDSVRIWVPACATGEEAYSLAIMFLEHPAIAEKRLRLQVFGTDIDKRALEVARKGRYLETIEHTVSRERLQRFFVRQGTDYQVRKDLREALMFAPQNVVTDPPFSHMDLVSCRNLLIYMEPELQRRVLQMFHFALDAGGLLTLGKSETVGNQTGLFTSVSQLARIYRRVGAPRVTYARLPTAPGWRADEGSRPPVPPSREPEYGRVIREALLEHRVAAAMLLDREGRTLYFYGPVQSYLDLPEGSPTTDVYAMLRDELRPSLRAALHRAVNEKSQVEVVAAWGADDPEHPVRMVVTPLRSSGEDLMLVTFERLAADERPLVRLLDEKETSALRVLEDELRSTKRELRASIEELESTNEELKVANEEAMSMNEELQSTNEELETSKEELQSVNEELITVNNQLQEKVLELETVNDDLGNLLSSTHMPTLFLDRQLRIKRFTPAATRLFSLIATDLNRPLTDIAGQTDLASLIADAQAVLVDLTPRQQDVRSTAGDHFLRRTLPYRTQEDRIDGIVVTFTDITEIKRATEWLRRFAAVTQTSNDAIIVHDLNGKLLAWNRAAQAMYGHAEADVIGSDINALLPKDSREAYAAQVERVRGGERLQGIESRRLRRDGSLIDVSTTLSLVNDEEGRPAVIALIERDITPRKRADEALRESEARFRLLADGAPASMWMCSEDGTIAFANREFARLTGAQPEQLIGRRWTDLLHPDDQFRFVNDPTGERDANRLEATVQLRDGQGGFRWMKIAVQRRDVAGDSPSLIGSMVDIDAQMRAERDLRLADRRKDEFLAMLGHELRNPLVPIRNAAEVLNHVQATDARVHWVRDTLVRQVDHVTRLVDDLLDISMITRGTVRLHLQPVDLGHAVNRAIEAAASLMHRKHHNFDWQLAPEALWVEADSIRLAQVFENLLTNAAKYTEDKGSITLLVQRDGEDAVVTVRDSGLGIAPAMLPRVFDLFVQDERSIDRSQGGLGIGLSLVRHLVELHGGRVSAASEGIGSGSEFVVRLPLLPQSQQKPPEPVESVPVGTGGRVLIVDDDVEAAESMVVLLGLFGYEVEYANGLDAALTIARRFAPQVVLLDLAMPHADGYEVAARLRALPEMADGAAYLALSGFGQPEDFRRTAEAGFARHLVKPVDPVELDRLMRALIGG